MPPNTHSLPTCTYLYGLLPSDLPSLSSMTYSDALSFKISQAKSLLSRLLHKPFQSQDSHRINDVMKAIKFNQRLMDELHV